MNIININDIIQKSLPIDKQIQNISDVALFKIYILNNLYNRIHLRTDFEKISPLLAIEKKEKKIFLDIFNAQSIAQISTLTQKERDKLKGDEQYEKIMNEDIEDVNDYIGPILFTIIRKNSTNIILERAKKQRDNTLQYGDKKQKQELVELSNTSNQVLFSMFTKKANEIKTEAQKLIDKFKFKRIVIKSDQVLHDTNIIKSLYNSMEISCKRLGVKAPALSFLGGLHLTIDDDESCYGSIDSNNCSLTLSTFCINNKKHKTPKLTTYETVSTIVHEWIHGLDTHILERYYFKHEQHRYPIDKQPLLTEELMANIKPYPSAEFCAVKKLFALIISSLNGSTEKGNEIIQANKKEFFNTVWNQNFLNTIKEQPEIIQNIETDEMMFLINQLVNEEASKEDCAQNIKEIKKYINKNLPKEERSKDINHFINLSAQNIEEIKTKGNKYYKYEHNINIKILKKLKALDVVYTESDNAYYAEATEVLARFCEKQLTKINSIAHPFEYDDNFYKEFREIVSLSLGEEYLDEYEPMEHEWQANKDWLLGGIHKIIDLTNQ